MQTLTDPEQLKSPAVVLEFGAKWCQPCRQLEPVLDELDEEHTTIQFYRADVDKHTDLARDFGVRSVPAVFILQAGQIVDSFFGSKPKSAVRRHLGALAAF
jgi:thioredoxin 1